MPLLPRPGDDRVELRPVVARRWQRLDAADDEAGADQPDVSAAISA